jgi:hypothetical protein
LLPPDLRGELWMLSGLPPGGDADKAIGAQPDGPHPDREELRIVAFALPDPDYGLVEAKFDETGIADGKAHDDISVGEVLRGSDADDAETIAAIREGVGDVEAALSMFDAGKTYKTVVARLDEEMRDWWSGELNETEDGKPKYQEDCASLKTFLADDALPWRRGRQHRVTS